MTIQIRDRILLDGEEYAIPDIPLEDSDWPDVKRFISSVQRVSIWGRGYRSNWAIREQRLVLVDLVIMWAGRLNWLQSAELFPDHPNGVPADWFSGEIAIPQGEEVDFGNGHLAHAESLVLTIQAGQVMRRELRDNREAEQKEALRMEKIYLKAMQPIRKPLPLPSIEEIETPETAISAECGDFMLEACMGAVDDNWRQRWRDFYRSAMRSATAEEKLLLEVVNTAVEGFGE